MNSTPQTVSITQAIEIATRHLQEGRLPQAEAILRQVLSKEPNHAAALHFLGVIAHRVNKHDAAAELIRRSIAANPNSPQAFSNLGAVLQKSGKLEEAIQSYRRALELKPDYAAAYNNLGNALQEGGQLEEARECFEQALELEPNDAQVRYNLGNVFKEQKKYDEAMACYRQALELKPDFAEAGNNLGALLQQQGRLEEAIQCFQRIFGFKPDDGQAHYNLGNVYQEQSRLDEAIESYRRALAANPDSAEAHNNLGNVLKAQGRFDEAAQCFRRALELKPDHPEARNNLANVLRDEGELDQAVQWYGRALEARADFPEAHNNLGNVLREQGKFQEAIGCYRRALELKPDFPDAHFNLGHVFFELRRPDEAIRCYRRTLELRPDHVEARASLLHQLQHVCDWPEIGALSRELLQAVHARPEARITPLVIVAAGGDAAEQLRGARNWVLNSLEPYARMRERLGFAFEAARKPRLRVGYLSADFRIHPVAHQTAELFELHDRSRFEIFGYSYGPDDGSPIRARLAGAFDRFSDIRALSIEDAARQIHADRIDVLVDLTGYTQYCRPAILALRPAPVQVNYLGYPGTLGADFVDYLITDKFVSPPDQAPFYAEKPVYLLVYQANDRQRPAAAQPARSEHGLPEKAFVFSCFNQSFKILPEVFEVWMRLLRALPESVLWLSRSNPWASENLQREAGKRGVAAARLVFAPKLAGLDQHLARIGLADLFLDTLPYNAHATASDALWAGVPLLTCAGNTFSSRVAGSLLHAVGLPEMVTGSLGEYEARALHLATHPQELAAIREKLGRNRLSAPLFDSERFTRHLEAAYRAMWERYCSGSAPQAIEIPAG
ncbi:MAG: tetratricopeptide repeat protein [Betaproteobacteria bacterium]|nr:tetratricopeptide repeat protein [Betaproteobacteria bacterium]